MTTRKTSQDVFKTYAFFDGFILILHWSWLLAFFVSLISGLRIAADHRNWIQANLDWLAMTGQVFTWHLSSAVVIALSWVTYVMYLTTTQQLSRLNPFILRASGQRSVEPLRAMHVIGILLLFIATLTGLVLLYESVMLEDATVRLLHFSCAISISLFLFMHVAVIVWRGGISLVLSVFQFSWPKNRFYLVTLFISMIMVALGAYLFGTVKHEYMVTVTEQTMAIDGKANEAAWQNSEKLVLSNKLGNTPAAFTEVSFQALQDEQNIYLLITWSDAEKSLSHTPIIKTEQGWKPLTQGFEKDDEIVWYEDKLAVMLANDPFAAMQSIFLGPKPLKDAPESRSGRGYHFRTDHNIADIWHWKAWRTDSLFQAEDAFIGTPRQVLPWQVRYEAGMSKDPKYGGGYTFNWKWFAEEQVIPKRLPRTSRFVYASNGSPKAAELKPISGMRWNDTVPYKLQSDQVPLYSIVPSTMTKDTIQGDQGDVRARGIWHDGVWTLELARLKDTGSEFDIALRDKVYVWLSVFNHAQTRHSYHLRPIELHL